MQPENGFFIWDKPGHPTLGWSFRESGGSVGGSVSDDPVETEKQIHERWDAGTDLAHWFGGPLPPYWRPATADEVVKLMLCSEVLKAISYVL